MAIRADVPTVYVNDHDRATRDAWRVLSAANRDEDATEFIFRYGDAPCRFEYNDEGKLAPGVLNSDRMRLRLNQIANWKRKEGAKVTAMTGAPRDVVSMVLAVPNPPLPLVTTLVDVPVFTPKGKVVTEPGYNADAKLFYSPARGLDVPTVPQRPKQADLERARELIVDELLADFPFKGDADRAHAVCMFLQPFVRSLIDGETPLYLSDAPTPGSGKGLLVRACSMVALGGEPTLMMPGPDEAEWRKRITSTLLSAPSIVLLDNITTMLDSGAFSALLTAPHWTDRLLGLNRNVTLPNRAEWVISGNNVSMSTELTRRTVRIVLDSGEEHPEDRPGNTFRHPDLLGWARGEARGELIWAALVLGRYWVVKGRPPGRETMGSYEAWARVMGGILRTAGIDGLLTNRLEQRDQTGSEREQMITFLDAWNGAHGSTRMKASDVSEAAWKVLGIDAWGDRAPVAMGFKLKQYADRPFDGLVLRRAKREDGSLATRGKSALWYVEPSADAPSPPGDEAASRVVRRRSK